MNKMKLYVGALAVLLLLPQSSQAYFTTAQSATRMSADTILYTVSYDFGFAGRELYMPIIAARGLQATDPSPLAGFTIYNQDREVITGGTANAIILSSDEDVQIRDNQYYLPLRKSAKFTLVALLTIPEGEQVADQDLYLEVSRLPFTMVKDGAEIPAHLNASELQYYKTPEVTL